MKDRGLPTHLFGLVYALSSILGIALGYVIHMLRKLSLQAYTILDTLVLGGTFLLAGLGHSLPTAVASFVISMGWWRLRNILYQHHLLKLFKHSEYKATLVSLYAFFIRCNEVWLPFIFVLSTRLFGYYRGYAIIGASSLIVLVPSLLVATRLARRWESGH